MVILATSAGSCRATEAAHRFRPSLGACAKEEGAADEAADGVNAEAAADGTDEWNEWAEWSECAGEAEPRFDIPRTSSVIPHSPAAGKERGRNSWCITRDRRLRYPRSRPITTANL